MYVLEKRNFYCVEPVHGELSSSIPEALEKAIVSEVWTQQIQNSEHLKSPTNIQFFHWQSWPLPGSCP